MEKEKLKMEISESGQKSSIGAKEYSKVAMIFSSVWIITLTILKACGVFRIEMTDIIYSAISVVAVWSPTYMSIWLDKVRDIRFGGGRHE